MRGCAWDRERGKRRAKFAIGKIEPLCATASTSLHAHTCFAPLLISFLSPARVPLPFAHPSLFPLLPPLFFFFFPRPPPTAAPRPPLLPHPCVTSIPCISPFPGTHGSCKGKGAYVRVRVRLGTAAKNESQYVHDKIYIYI